MGWACIRPNSAGCETDGTWMVVLFGCSIIQKIWRNGYQLTNEVGRPWGWIEWRLSIFLKNPQNLNEAIFWEEKANNSMCINILFIIKHRDIHILFMMIV